MTDFGEPECYEEAMHVDLVEYPGGKIALQNKWVYRLKEEDVGKNRYKDILVVKGFTINKGIGVNPWTWVTLFGKRISSKIKKHTSVEGLRSPRSRF